MNDWNEYIESYFGNKALFKVAFNESNNFITIISSKTEIKIRIDFIFAGSSYERLVEIQFCNGFDYSESYCVQFLGEKNFTTSIKNIVDSILIVPVHKGWIEEDFYFISKKPYKTKFYFNDYGKKDYVAYNSLIGLWVAHAVHLATLRVTRHINTLIRQQRIPANVVGNCTRHQ